MGRGGRVAGRETNQEGLVGARLRMCPTLVRSRAENRDRSLGQCSAMSPGWPATRGEGLVGYNRPVSSRAWRLVIAFVVPPLAIAGFIAVPLAAGRSAEIAPDPPPPLRLVVAHAGRDPRTIDLASVVPRGGTLDHVWF